jgi:hypothetical protein
MVNRFGPDGFYLLLTKSFLVGRERFLERLLGEA